MRSDDSKVLNFHSWSNDSLDHGFHTSLVAKRRKPIKLLMGVMELKGQEHAQYGKSIKTATTMQGVGSKTSQFLQRTVGAYSNSLWQSYAGYMYTTVNSRLDKAMINEQYVRSHYYVKLQKSDAQLYCYYRMMIGLPVHGQCTQSNAKTSRSLNQNRYWINGSRSGRPLTKKNSVKKRNTTR
jgi:ribosomal protein S13